MEADDFNDNMAPLFAQESGVWSVTGGQLHAAPAVAGGEAVNLFFVSDQLPSYYELLAAVNADKDRAGVKSNGHVIFDYYSETDYKFAGIDVGTDKLQIGRRTADGWIVEAQGNMQLKAGTNYNLLVAVHGTTVTLVVDGNETLSHVFEPRELDGELYGLNTGMVGVAADNSVTRFDNVAVRKLAPQSTFEHTEDFTDGTAELFDGDPTGIWAIEGGQYAGTPSAGTDTALNFLDLSTAAGLGAGELSLQTASWLELGTTLSTGGTAGFVFDYYGPEDFKFVAVMPETDQVVIGHRTARGWFYDAVFETALESGSDYDLTISLVGSSVSVELDGETVLGHVYNSVLVDGGFGLLSKDGTTTFSEVTVKTDDPIFAEFAGV
jgi:hypothetical protein